MSKFNPVLKPLSEDQGKQILSAGVYLGRSKMEKDCYWSCYQYEENFYISLNSWFAWVWEVDSEDIEKYCDIPETIAVKPNAVKPKIADKPKSLEELNKFIQSIVKEVEASDDLHSLQYSIKTKYNEFVKQ